MICEVEGCGNSVVAVSSFFKPYRLLLCHDHLKKARRLYMIYQREKLVLTENYVTSLLDNKYSSRKKLGESK